jgi:quinol-cytochrome oxidoreductase complex cytochrome b subunit
MLMGGTQPGAATLIRFYAWHLFGLTLVAIIVMVWHAFRVRRDGGIAVPPPNLRTDHDRISRSELVRREVLAMLFTGAALILLSTFVPAPISAPIKEISASAADANAPWFFLWVQQMLKWGDPFVWVVAVPLILLIILILIPYVLPLPVPSEIGRWFPKSNRVAQNVLGLIAFMVIILTLITLLPGP